MSGSWAWIIIRLVARVSLIILFSACASQHKPVKETDLSVQEAASQPPRIAYLSKPRKIIKTTMQECEIRGGEYIAHEDPRPQDIVDCWLPGQFRRLGKYIPILLNVHVLTSVYEYLHRTGIEKPGYGLYSYALFPVHSSRAERFSEDLFKTTGYVVESRIDFENLNVIYLPTREDRLSSLLSVLSESPDPPADTFAEQFYDYALARRLLAQICTEPAEEIRDICATDLSRGPYLFTYSQPVSELSIIPPPYLFLDLSYVHERAFSEFIAAYKEQIKRPDYTDRERVNTLRLRLLSIVLTAADWVEPIRVSIADILHMAGGKSGPAD